jgi:hypothetical protein
VSIVCIRDYSRKIGGESLGVPGMSLSLPEDVDGLAGKVRFRLGYLFPSGGVTGLGEFEDISSSTIYEYQRHMQNQT